MNHDQQLDALDRRAEAAATTLQAQAARRPRPAFDPDRPVTLAPPAPAAARTLRRPALAVAAVVVVLAGVAGALALRPDDRDGDQAAVTADGPRPFAATDLPDGLRLSRAFEAPPSIDGSDDGPVPTDLYGPAADRPGLGIGAFPTTPDRSTGPDRIDLGGGRAAEVRDLGLPGTVLSLEVEGTTVVVVGPTEDRDLLERVAGALQVVDGRPVVDPAVLPDGWRKIGTVPDLVGATGPLSSTTPAGGGAELLTAYAQGDGFDERMVVVGSSAGDQARLHALRLVTTDVRPVTVRGKQGLAGTVVGDGPVIRTLAWLERPGELVRVSGPDLSVSDLVQVAEGVEPIEGDAWAELLRRSEVGDLRDPDGVPPTRPVGEGRFADGTTWVLRPTLATARDEVEEPQVELVVDLPAGGDGTSFSSSGTRIGGEAPGPLAGFRGVSTMTQSGRTFLYGIIGDGVAAVEVHSEDTSDVPRATIVEGQGIRAWVYEQTESQIDVVAVGADGTELDRATLRDGGREIVTEATATTTPAPGPGG